MDLIPRIIGKCLRTRPIGTLISGGLLAVGAEGLSRRSSRHSAYVPSKVPLRMDGSSSVVMDSATGNDYVACTVWRDGWDGFERPLPRLYACVVTESNTFLGVGASSGFYELITAATSASNAIYAFEPYPPAVECLRRNLYLNGFEERVHVIETGVADHQGTMELYVPEKRFGETLETSASLRKSFAPAHSAVITIQITTLDAFVAEMGLTNVDVIRIDVEGAEDLVLSGAENILTKHRPLVFMEVLEVANTEAHTKTCIRHDYLPLWFDTDESLRPAKEVIHRQSNPNQVLCPLEKLSQLKRLASHAGIGFRE